MAPHSSVTSLPDHTQLPDSDSVFVKNFQEHPQSILLTESIWPTLQRLHPEGQFCIGQDSGIYWRMTDPPERGAEAPDWFYVANVPPTLDGQIRRSYVMWQEFIAPLIILEFFSGNGSEERDPTSWKGKFWIYEQVIRPAFYGIYEVQQGTVEVYRHVENHFEPVAANQQGRYPIPQLGVELGIWSGLYKNVNLPWLRWWNDTGHLLLNAEERAEQERQRADWAEQQAEQERQRADRLAEKLRQCGVDPDGE
ncbi:MAG: Uma2 family endonuclease [Aphanocapsa sp. GSE-SYN-MK-11-07L]|jgi:Uma2 family endonuclease|nr:Uma2 family endonuclease [Aphanocapsa sp. GSE-SYN-MK-11-07L]